MMMGVVVISAMLEPGLNLFKNLVETRGIFLGLTQLLDVVGMFMMVIIAIELMPSMYEVMIRLFISK